MKIKITKKDLEKLEVGQVKSFVLQSGAACHSAVSLCYYMKRVYSKEYTTVINANKNIITITRTK